MRVGRIPYVNCYPVYGAIDRGVVPLGATIVTGVPSALNRHMAEGTLDVSVVSAVVPQGPASADVLAASDESLLPHPARASAPIATIDTRAEPWRRVELRNMGSS